MLSKITRKIFGSRNDRIIKILNQRVVKINALETGLQPVSYTHLTLPTTPYV